MIKRNRKLWRALFVALDYLLIFFSYMVATWVRFDLMYGEMPNLAAAWNRQYLWAAAIYAAALVALYIVSHLYHEDIRSGKRMWGEMLRVMELNALSVLVFMAFLYLTRLADFTRIGIFLFYLFSTGAILVRRLALYLVLRSLRRKGFNQKHVIVVGNGRLAHKYMQDVRANPDNGYIVDGYVSREERPELGRCLGAYEDLPTVLQDDGIDEVVVALEAHETSMMGRVIQAVEKQGVKVSIIPFFNEYIPTRPTVDMVGETKLINIRTIPLDNLWNAFWKRALDVVGSLFLIVLTSPVMLAVAIGVKLSSPGPVIFKQQRVGRGKKLFYMYKFRSMRVNSDSNTAWSTNVDDRKTAFGSFIRKFSLDELPQFFNVLGGSMSLVGPRPEIPYFVDQFRESIPLYMVKHQVRPGITGWAQVNGYRGDTSIAARIKCDIWYIENWSLWLDIRILFKTVFGGMMNQERLQK